MTTIFLTTIISCNQLLGIAKRMESVGVLTIKQKTALILELRKLVPDCPILVRPYELKNKKDSSSNRLNDGGLTYHPSKH